MENTAIAVALPNNVVAGQSAFIQFTDQVYDYSAKKASLYIADWVQTGYFTDGTYQSIPIFEAGYASYLALEVDPSVFLPSSGVFAFQISNGVNYTAISNSFYFNATGDSGESTGSTTTAVPSSSLTQAMSSTSTILIESSSSTTTSGTATGISSTISTTSITSQTTEVGLDQVFLDWVSILN